MDDCFTIYILLKTGASGLILAQGRRFCIITEKLTVQIGKNML